MVSDLPMAARQGDWPWAWDWVGLLGPTASGKSAIAMALAQAFPVEIISVDSALVYQGMDVGSAKPSLSDRQLVPHHLLDICDPLQSLSAADFVRAAKDLIPAIQQRGRLPLLAGGTMLYFKALIEGLDPMPASDNLVRSEIEAQAEREGWPAMHALLAQVDPTTAQRLPPNDAQRISRALEVWRISGRPLSAHFSLHLPAQKPGALRDTFGQRAFLLSLEPVNRSWLHQRIESRFDQMLEQGLLAEVLRLRALPGWHPQLPAMRCVGYRQAWPVLAHWESLGWTAKRLLASMPTTTANAHSGWNAAHTDPALKTGLDEWRSTSLAATRQLAKRQLTWLRGMKERQVVACDVADASTQVLEQVKSGIKPARQRVSEQGL